MASALTIETGVEDAAEWDAFAAVHPQATLFHQASWQRVLARALPYRACSLLARREGRVVGILPLYQVRHLPFGHSLVSAPLAVYGGIVADDAAAADALLEHARREADRRGVRYLELRHRVPLGELPVKERYVTFRKAIQPDPDANMAAIPRNQRRSIRQGHKFGLVSRVGGEELLGDFYPIYAESQRNLGTPVLPLGLFRALFAELGPSCRILTVEHEGRLVAGVVTFFFRDEVLPYYGGARRDAFRYAVNDFMYWSLLCHGAERGFRWFDFGRSKVDSGSYHFKRHWGFEPTPLAYQYHLVRERALPDLSPMNPRYQLAIRMWKRMPLWLARRLGPGLVRFFT